MADVKHYAIYNPDGSLHTYASIDLDDEDTEIDATTGQPFSKSGDRGIAHPDILQANGHSPEIKEVPFNPDIEPEPGKRYEWDTVKLEPVIVDIPVKSALDVAIVAAERLSLAEKTQLKAML